MLYIGKLRVNAYKAAFEASLDAIVCADEAGLIALWNPAAEALLGYSAAEALGEPVSILIAPTDKSEHVPSLERFLTSGESRMTGQTIEVKVARADGTVLLVDMSLTTSQTAKGWTLTSVLRDATERKRDRERLQASETLLASAGHIARLGGWTLDAKTLDVSWTDEVYRIHELPVGGPPSLESALDFYEPEDRVLVSQAVDRALSQGVPFDLELRFNTAKQTRLRVRAVGEPVVVDAQTVRLTGIFQDITERRTAQEKARQFRRVVEDALDEIYVFDAETLLFVDVNRCARENLGYDLDELSRMTPLDLGPEVDASILSELVAPLRSGASKKVNFTSVHRRKDGRTYPVEVHLQLAESDPLLFVAFVLDITERTEAGSELARRNEQVGQLVSELQEALEGTVTAVAKAVEIRDPYTAGHQRRVAELSEAIASQLGLDPERVRGIHLGAIIHDIGKLSLPAEILSKPSRLSAVEFALVREHSEAGHRILRDVKLPWPVADIAHQHHERIDGSGYPLGLRGEEICLEARIVAVADVVEAMCNDRPYRVGLGLEAALDEVSSGSGTRYDIDVVEACLTVFRDGQFLFSDH